MVDGEIAALYVTAGANVTPFQRGMNQVRGELRGVSGEASNVMSTIRNLAGVMAAALGGAAVINAAVGFDRSMANIRAVTGRTVEEMAALQSELVRIGSASTVGPQAVADAFYDIAGGVADASTHMAILDAAIATSEAGQASLTATTSGLIAAMNAYGLGADDAMTVSDLLTRAVGVGVGTMDEFVSAMSPVFPTMASAGVGIDEFSGMMAYMTTKGVSASMSATQLRQAVIALINPNKAMTEGLRAAGFASGTEAIRAHGLKSALAALRGAVGGNVDAMAEMLGSAEALNAGLILTEGQFEDLSYSADFTEFFGNFIEGAEGATEAARALQMESVSAQLDKLKATLEGLAITVGTALLPVLGTIAQFGVDVLNAIIAKGPEIATAIADWFSGTQIGQDIGRAWTVVQPAIQGLADKIRSAFSALFDAGGSGVSFEGPRELFDQTMSGIRDLPVGPARDLAEKLAPRAEVGTRIQWFFEDIKTAILEGVPNVLNTLSSEISRIGTNVVNSLNTFVDGLQIPQPIKDAIELVLTPLKDAFQKLGEIDWSNLLLAGGVILGIGVGIGALGLALNLVRKIFIFSAIVDGLEALSRVINDLKTGDFSTFFTDLGDAFIAFGAALTLANLPAVLSGIGSAIGTGGVVAGAGVATGTGLLLKLGLLGLAIGGLFTLMEQPWVQEGLKAWEGVFDNLEIIVQTASDNITNWLNDAAQSIADFMGNSIFTTGVPMPQMQTGDMPPTFSGSYVTGTYPTLPAQSQRGAGRATTPQTPLPFGPTIDTGNTGLSPAARGLINSLTAPTTVTGSVMFPTQRGSGGPLWPGLWMVGEYGPEILSVGKGGGGYVQPNSAARNMGNGGESRIIHNVLYLDGKVVYESVTKERDDRNGRGWMPG